MKYVMSREEEPSFVIRDPRYVNESTNCTSLLHIFKGNCLMIGGVRDDSHEVCFRPTDLHPHKVGLILPILLSELIGARTQMEQIWLCHPCTRD